MPTLISCCKPLHISMHKLWHISSNLATVICTIIDADCDHTHNYVHMYSTLYSHSHVMNEQVMVQLSHYPVHENKPP